MGSGVYGFRGLGVRGSGVAGFAQSDLHSFTIGCRSLFFFAVYRLLCAGFSAYRVEPSA